MFNLNWSQDDKNSNENNIKSEWLKYSHSSKKDEMFDILANDNKFIKEDVKLRSVVIDMLEKEFGKNIKNIKEYDFLVDSVVNKLKQNQLDEMPVEDIN